MSVGPTQMYNILLEALLVDHLTITAVDLSNTHLSIHKEWTEHSQSNHQLRSQTMFIASKDKTDHDRCHGGSQPT